MRIPQRPPHESTIIKQQSTGFLSWFWDLASDDLSRRQESISKIVLHLQALECNKEDMAYALKRLIRGLTSSRESARQGFAVCLCQIIRNFEDINIIEVMDSIDETTKVTGNRFIISIFIYSFITYR